MAPSNCTKTKSTVGSSDNLCEEEEIEVPASPHLTCYEPPKEVLYPSRFVVSPVPSKCSPSGKEDHQGPSTSAKVTIVLSPCSSLSSIDEGFIDSRDRHASAESRVSTDGAVGTADEDDCEVRSATSEIGKKREECGDYERDALLRDKEAQQVQVEGLAFACQSTICDETTQQTEFTTSEEPLLPQIITTSVTDIPGVTESALSSQWEISTGGYRNPAVQFFLGSRQSLCSAASSVSFFHTLYAHGYSPICRICHQPSSDKEPLTAPCHCAGSLRFIHHTCLLRWLEMRSQKGHQSPKCELCQFQFVPRRTWRPWRQLVYPVIPMRDKILHILFVLAVITMIICASVTVVVFQKQSNFKWEEQDGTKEEGLTRAERATLASGVFFFFGFFVAMSAQIKAKWSLCKIVRVFAKTNHVLQLPVSGLRMRTDADLTAMLPRETA